MDRIKLHAALIAALLGAGCATTRQQEPDVDHMAALAQLAAFNGTVIRLLNHPDDLNNFVTVRDTLRTQLLAGEFSPAAFGVTMGMLPINELHSTEAALLIGSAMVLWDAYKQQVIDLDDSTYIRPVMEAVASGLDRGIIAARER